MELGWPPSTNQTWRSYNRGDRHCVILSESARLYRLDVASRVAVGRAKGLIPSTAFSSPVGVDILLRKPDNRKRDLDNTTKSLLDALTKAGVWADDSLVHDIRLRWDGVEKPGKVTIKIWNMEILE